MNQFEPHEDIFSILDVKRFFYLLWSWTWLILLAGLSVGAVAYVVSIRTIPIYQTSARLLVSDPPSTRSLDTTSMVSTQSMTGTYREMLVDWVVLQGVIDRLNLNVTPAAIQNEIIVTTISGTQLLVVTVRDPDPNRAKDIANTLGQVFADHIRELQTQRYSASQTGLAKQVSDMEQQINVTTQAISTVTNSAEKLQLEARLTQYRSLYANLVTNFEQVRLAEAQTSTNVVVSQPAVTTEQVIPKTNTNVLLGFLAGALLAMLVVILIDVLDDTLKNPDQIRQKLNLAILGMITIHPTEDNKPISLMQPRSPAAESFRSLRTNLTFSSVDKPIHRILITSTMPQEGKTTVSANLAVVFAQGEKKVILIDADLRKPQIHRRFGLSNRVGLSELFVSSWDVLPQVIQTGALPELGVITSGGLPPNPSDLLSSQKMAHILERINQDFSLIIIDTPPVLSVTDACALAPAVDGVLLVAQPGKTRMHEFQQAIQQLRSVNANILGVVLNDVDPGNRKYGYYYGRYGAGYSNYYEDNSGKRKRSKSAAAQKTSA